MDFELESRAAAQALYRTVTEFHTFFKRDAVSRVVKTAGFCKSLLGNFKGQNPDRFYFDVMRTHREVIDHVWVLLHPSTRFQHGDENVDNSSRGSSATTSANRANTSRRGNRNSHYRTLSSGISSRHGSTSTASSTTEDGGHDPAPPLPPPSRHMQRGGSMQRSHSVQDTGLRPPNFTHLPPLPPYSQRSCSSDTLIRANLLRRPHLRTIPTHGPHMASTATFNPYLSPSISETGSEDDEDLYGGGSECYVTMSSCSDATYLPSRSDATYLPSTHSDPGTMSGRRTYRPMGMSNPSPLPLSDTSGAPSDLYMTSVGSDCSGASYRVNSPPPLYREIDEEHSVPLNFDPAPSPNPDSAPNSAAPGVSLASPIIPIARLDQGGRTFDFDAADVLSRTQELEGELQRLRAAMTCRVCKQNPIGATFCPCGHTVCCYPCAQRMHSCRECDETVTSVQKMLLTR